MLLQDKNAIIYGAGGAVGGALARAFAHEGARVHLAGRTLAPLKQLAMELAADGGEAYVEQVNALDKNAVDRHAEVVVSKDGRIDVSVNVVGVDHIQGVPLRELSLGDFLLPISTYLTAHFLTSCAAARHMARQRRGVILTMSTTAARVAMPTDGFGPACAAVEALTLQLAGELGPFGVRVVCLRPDALPEAVPQGSHVAKVWRRAAERAGVTLDNMLADPGVPGALLDRSPTLSDVADTAVFLASDKAGALTATVANLSCGSVSD